jgi:membrane dipeptidase
VAGVDGHSDALIEVARRRLRGERRALADRHVAAMRRADLSTQFLVVGGDFPLFAGDQVSDPLRDHLELMDVFWAEQEEAKADLGAVLWAEDVDDYEGERVGFVLHWEGAGVLRESLAPLRAAWREGLRSIGLTWNAPNGLADGCGEPRGGGLTELGKRVVREANRLGIVVDVSHLCDRSARDVFEVAAAPPMASHSNARAVHDHPRNLVDDDIRAIAELGGIVGICAYPPMLSDGDATIEDMVRQIDHICALIGPQSVGVGADFIDFIDPSWAESAIFWPYREALLQPFPTGFETLTAYPNLAEELGRRGYAEDVVAGIMGGNFRRLLREVLPARARRDAI